MANITTISEHYLSYDPFNYKYGKKYRYQFFKEILPQVNDIEGTYVEIGAGKGKTLAQVIDLMNESIITKRNIWAFDSFQGFPAPNVEFDGNVATIGLMATTNELVSELSSSIDVEFNIIEGWFENLNSSNPYTLNDIAILHLDCSLYSSYLSSLNYFYDKVVSGGVIIFDEYNDSHDLEYWPGAQIGINEFFENRNLNLNLNKVYFPESERYTVYIIKE